VTVDYSHTIAVSCRKVTKEFGHDDTRVMALRGVDVGIPLGEMTLLVGPSGCGKTTLLSVIAGILEATSGDVTVLGQHLGKMSKSRTVEFRRQKIGFVFQQFNLLPALTAAQNASVPLIIAGMPRRKAFEKARELLVTLGLGKRLDALPADMSGGEQQRVAIARSLVHEPALLVCDEPTSALDAANGSLIMDLLKRVAVQPDRAVVVVTHDSRVFKFGDRIATMDDGKVVKVETAAPAESVAVGSEGASWSV